MTFRAATGAPVGLVAGRSGRLGRAGVVVVVAAAWLGGCGPSGPYDGFRDRGDPTSVAALRDAVAGLVEAENAVGRLVPDADGVLTDELNTSPAAAERRRTELEAVATPARAHDELEVIEGDVAELVASPELASQLGYTQAELEVDEYAGISVEGDTATVVLRGTECYRHLDGETTCEPLSDFRITLRTSSTGTWLIDEKTSRHRPGLGP